MRLAMKKIFLIVLIAITLSCKEQPNYNPFDGQFNVSVNSIISNGCDTLSAECGYYNLIQKTSGMRTYYQIHTEDFSEVVGKGFVYTFDTTSIVYVDDLKILANLVDSVAHLPVDTGKFAIELKKYGYEITDLENEKIRIVNSFVNDTIDLTIRAFLVSNSRNRITRIVSYFKSPKNYE